MTSAVAVSELLGAGVDMEIRVNPIVIEFVDLWRALCENACDLVSKGITWDVFAPACEEAANAIIQPDRVDIFLRLSERAFRKYEKELLS